MRLSDLRTAAEIHEQDMKDDPEYRREWERTRAQNDAEIKTLRESLRSCPGT